MLPQVILLRTDRTYELVKAAPFMDYRNIINFIAEGQQDKDPVFTGFRPFVRTAPKAYAFCDDMGLHKRLPPTLRREGDNETIVGNILIFESVDEEGNSVGFTADTQAKLDAIVAQLKLQQFTERTDEDRERWKSLVQS